MCYEFEGLFRRRSMSEKLQRKIEAIKELRRPAEQAAETKPAEPQVAAAPKPKQPVTV
jgi:hypothetical protein